MMRCKGVGLVVYGAKFYRREQRVNARRQGVHSGQKSQEARPAWPSISVKLSLRPGVNLMLIFG